MTCSCTHARLGLVAGVPIAIMSARPGHPTTAFTMDAYVHVISAPADEVAELTFEGYSLIEGHLPNGIIVNGVDLGAENENDSVNGTTTRTTDEPTDPGMIHAAELRP